jgi:hypothetical protein
MISASAILLAIVVILLIEQNENKSGRNRFN